MCQLNNNSPMFKPISRQKWINFCIFLVWWRTMHPPMAILVVSTSLHVIDGSMSKRPGDQTLQHVAAKSELLRAMCDAARKMDRDNRFSQHETDGDPVQVQRNPSQNEGWEKWINIQLSAWWSKSNFRVLQATLLNCQQIKFEQNKSCGTNSRDWNTHRDSTGRTHHLNFNQDMTENANSKNEWIRTCAWSSASTRRTRLTALWTTRFRACPWMSVCGPQFGWVTMA